MGRKVANELGGEGKESETEEYVALKGGFVSRGNWTVATVAVAVAGLSLATVDS